MPVRLGARKLPKSFISPFVCLLFLNRNINKWLARTGGNWTTVQLCGSYSCSHSIVGIPIVLLLIVVVVVVGSSRSR